MAMTVEPIIVVFISAAGGALVSSCFTLVGQSIERKAKHKELIFNAAIAQAKQRVATGIELAKLSGLEGSVPDEVNLAGTYYQWLEHLFEHGKLPPEAIEAEKASVRQMEEAEKQRSERIKRHNERVVSLAEAHPLTARQLLSTTDPTVLSDDHWSRLNRSATMDYS